MHEHRQQNGGNFGDHGGGSSSDRLHEVGWRRRARSLPEWRAQVSPELRRRCSDNSWSSRSRRGRSPASFEFYRSLGFTSHPGRRSRCRDPYVALFDGDVAIGLHERDAAGPACSRSFGRGCAITCARFGSSASRSNTRTSRDDEFNMSCFTDPDGQAITLLEARTFRARRMGPPQRAGVRRVLRVQPRDAFDRGVARFWQPLGFAPSPTGEAPHAWQRLAGHGLVLGLHRGALSSGPELSLRRSSRRASSTCERRAIASRRRSSASRIAVAKPRC